VGAALGDDPRGLRTPNRGQVHFADHQREVAGDRLGPVADGDPGQVGRRPLGLGGGPLHAAGGRDGQSGRTGEQPIGEGLGGEVGVGGGECALEGLAFLDGDAGIAGPHRRLVEFQDPDLEQIGDRHHSVAHGDAQAVGAGALGFGGGPAHQAVGVDGQPARALHQSVGQHLDGVLGVAGGQLPGRLLALGPDGGLVHQPHRGLVVFGDLDLEGDPTDQSAVGDLGDEGPSGPAEAFARLPGPLAGRVDREPGRSLDQRPGEGSLQVGIGCGQLATGLGVLAHGQVRHRDDDRVGPGAGDGDGPAFLDWGEAVGDLDQDGVFAHEVGALRCPLEQSAHRQGHPVGGLEEPVGEGLLGQVVVGGGDELLERLGLDSDHPRERIKHRRVVEDGRGHHRHAAQAVVGRGASGEGRSDGDERLVGAHQGVGESGLGELQFHRVTGDDSVQSP